MKLLIPVFLIIPLLSFAQKQDNQPYRDAKGNVKTITEYELGSRDSSGKQVTDTFSLRIYNYDKAGSYSTMTHFEPLGTAYFRRHYYYDAHHNLTRQGLCGGRDTLSCSYTFYKYDEKNNLVWDSLSDCDTCTQHIINTYDEKGSLSEQKYLNYKNKVEGIFFFAYDEKNRETESKKYMKTILKELYKYTYDTNNNITEEKHYNGKGVCTHVHKWKYNKHNNITESVEYDGQNKMSEPPTRFRDFDANNNWHACIMKHCPTCIYTILKRDIEYYSQ